MVTELAADPVVECCDAETLTAPIVKIVAFTVAIPYDLSAANSYPDADLLTPVLLLLPSRLSLL